MKWASAPRGTHSCRSWHWVSKGASSTSCVTPDRPQGLLGLCSFNCVVGTTALAMTSARCCWLCFISHFISGPSVRTRHCRRAWRDLGKKQTNISLSIDLHCGGVNQSEMSPTHRLSKGLGDKGKQAREGGRGQGKRLPLGPRCTGGNRRNREGIWGKNICCFGNS